MIIYRVLEREKIPYRILLTDTADKTFTILNVTVANNYK